MNRRKAIQSIGIVSTGLLTFPACVSKPILNTRFLDETSFTFLEDLVQCILPRFTLVETPESTMDYILNIIEYCSSPDEIKLFTKGLSDLKTQFVDQILDSEKLKLVYTSAKEQVGSGEKTTLTETESILYTIDTVKKLATKHFTSSEYFQTNFMDYSFIPAPYQACVYL